MTEPDRLARNVQRQLELQPWFAEKIAATIATLEGLGFRPRIQDAWRSPVAQLAAFTSGHSKLKFGWHNVTTWDGKPAALAVDLLDDDHPTDNNPPTRRYLLCVLGAARSQGLTTGALFGQPEALRMATCAAADLVLGSGGSNVLVKISWDPTHIEPVARSPWREQLKQNALRPGA